jgi:hypothetical protein
VHSHGPAGVASAPGGGRKVGRAQGCPAGTSPGRALQVTDANMIRACDCVQVVRVLLDLLLDGTPGMGMRAACARACTVLLALEAERCADPVMTLRRQALVDWTELALAHPAQPPLWRYKAAQHTHPRSCVVR